MRIAETPPTNFGVILYPGFQALDAFGPLDALNILSQRFPIQLSILARTLEPVSTKTFINPQSNCAQSIVPTHTFDSPPENLEVLLIPGGHGGHSDEAMAPVIKFIAATYPSLQCLITVCTGSSIAARSGILDGRRATSNKESWKWATEQGPKVNWVPRARWVVDGNIYTSSGVSAGIDATLAFMDEVFGKEATTQVAAEMEYTRHLDPDEDPFATLYGL